MPNPTSNFSAILANQLKTAKANKKIPNFREGDTLKVEVKVVEGDKSRLQSYEGICIARRHAGIASSFTVRKISYGEGVERTFPLFSPAVDSIAVLRTGKVRRAKLYYLRGRKGKSARIAEQFREILEIGGENIANAKTMPITDVTAAGAVETPALVENSANKSEATVTTKHPESATADKSKTE